MVMKNLILFIAIALVAGVQGATAQVNTRLQVTSYDGALIQVYIDGVSYGDYNNQQVLDNLPDGSHQMQVVALYTDPNSNENYETSIFFGNIIINDGYELVAVVNANNQLQVADQVPLFPREHYRTVIVFRPFVIFGGTFGGHYYHRPVVIYNHHVEPRYIHYAPRPVYRGHPSNHHYNRPENHRAPQPKPQHHDEHHNEHHDDHHDNGHPNNNQPNNNNNGRNNNTHYGPRK
jgi:hypothetical protein